LDVGRWRRGRRWRGRGRDSWRRGRWRRRRGKGLVWRRLARLWRQRRRRSRWWPVWWEEGGGRVGWPSKWSVWRASWGRSRRGRRRGWRLGWKGSHRRRTCWRGSQWRRPWRRRRPGGHRLRDGCDVRKGRHAVAFPAAQEVGALGHRVHPVQVLVQPRGEQRRDRPGGAHRVRGGLKVAHVEPVQNMIPNREVDGGRLVGVDVHGVLVGVLLSGHGSAVLHGKDLEDQMRRRHCRRRRWWRRR
jgi:hypothetical protein